MNNKWRVSLTATLISIGLLMTACGGANEAITPTSPVETPEPTVEPTPEPTPTPLPYTAPLTGIGRETEAVNRPIAVLINNFAAARPQSGLSEADVVWEVLAEGGITRLVAIYQSTDNRTETIGPIRSNRAYLIDIADSFGAIMAHAGGSPEAYGILQKQGKPYLDEITNAGPSFWRSKDRKAPHNLYSDLEKLREGAERRKYATEAEAVGYTFAPDETMPVWAAVSTDTAADITITFQMQSYKVGYQYDEASGLYKRTINNEPHIDLNNGEQLTASNLVVFETGHKTLDSEGRLAVDLTTGGNAYLFQKGKKIDAEWERSADGMIRFVKGGAEVPFAPGKIYIHIVPNKQTLADHVVWVQTEGAGDTDG